MNTALASVRTYRRMPSLSNIADFWSDNGHDLLPRLLGFHIGWFTPHCFRCGWLSPVPAGALGNKWRFANGWLERAHLQDRSLGGPDEEWNLVPLCPWCHHAMPKCPTFAQGVDWVRDACPLTCPDWWQFTTDGLWGNWMQPSYPGWREFFRVRLAAAEAHEQLR